MTKMGFLFLIIAGILAMVVVARLASKTKKNEEGAASPPHRYYDGNKVDIALQKGLISLLLKKKIIGEEELLAEINRIKNDPSST